MKYYKNIREQHIDEVPTKVIIYEKYKDEQPVTLMKNWADQYQNNQSNWFIKHVKLFITDINGEECWDDLKSLKFVTNNKSIFTDTRDDFKDSNIYDIIINGESMLDRNYIWLVRLVGIFNRNYPYKKTTTKIKTINFWSIGSEKARQIVKEKSLDRENYEESMHMFGRITHETATSLWSLTHGVAFYTKPYEYYQKYDVIVISSVDNVILNLNKEQKAEFEKIYVIKEINNEVR